MARILRGEIRWANLVSIEEIDRIIEGLNEIIGT